MRQTINRSIRSISKQWVYTPKPEVYVMGSIPHSLEPFFYGVRPYSFQCLAGPGVKILHQLAGEISSYLPF